GLASARGAYALLAASFGAFYAVCLFPWTHECVALGQANALLGGIFGLALLAASRERGAAVAGAIAAIGGAVKLVPFVVLWPLGAARRWRALAVATVVLAVVLGVTFVKVPPDRLVSNIASTIAFQRQIDPDWLRRPIYPGWVGIFGALRHAPLAVASLGLGGL